MQVEPPRFADGLNVEWEVKRRVKDDIMSRASDGMELLFTENGASCRRNLGWERLADIKSSIFKM